MAAMAESLQQHRPPAYPVDADAAGFPSVPRTDLSLGQAPAPINLPDLKSLGLPNHSRPNSHYQSPNYSSVRDSRQVQTGLDNTQWGQNASISPNIFPQVPSNALRGPKDMTSPSESAKSYDEQSQSHQTPSMAYTDDPDVRMAAEALSGLGNPDFLRSPSNRNSTIAMQSHTSPVSQTTSLSQQETEPLLQLFTYKHPWVGGTINHSVAAYDWTKTNIAPGFVKSSAEFVERSIGSPVATGLKKTGVERRFRRYLKDRKPSALDTREKDGVGNKRRRVMSTASDEKDVEKGLESLPSEMHRVRTNSQASSLGEQLPAYDDNRSPPYGEQGMLKMEERPQVLSPTWSQQVVITTSGLGAALSESSRRSLKFCLGLLRRYTDHIGDLMRALCMLLEDYERTSQETEQGSPLAQNDAQTQLRHQRAGSEEAARRIAEKIKELGNDIVRTIKSVIDSVSVHTGSALPANAGALVRRQLMSVPQRWLIASAESTSTQTASDSQDQSSTTSPAASSSEAVRVGRHMLAFAKQGLDMIAQVSLVLSGTVESAESWLDRIGRRRSSEAQGPLLLDQKNPPPMPMEGLMFDKSEKR